MNTINAKTADIFPQLYKDYLNTKAVINNVNTVKYISTENMEFGFFNLMSKDVVTVLKARNTVCLAFHISVISAMTCFQL